MRVKWLGRLILGRSAQLKRPGTGASFAHRGGGYLETRAESGACRHQIPHAYRPVNHLNSPPICVAGRSRYGESGEEPLLRLLELGSSGTECRRFGGNVRCGQWP
jgi:hypothetical protein